MEIFACLTLPSLKLSPLRLLLDIGPSALAPPTWFDTSLFCNSPFSTS